MSADGSWSVCTHDLCLIVVLAMRLLHCQSCQQMVHGVFATMNICHIAVPLDSALVQRYSHVSADGSWSVCTHEHLTSLFSLCACHSTGHVGDGSWSVCTHEHLPDR
jgi:hypothetical protein